MLSQFCITVLPNIFPLCDLISPKEKFARSREQETAFVGLKKAFTQRPVLVQPNIGKARDGPQIYADLCRIDVGAVLAQEGDDALLLQIFFASKHLTGREKNYHVTH